MKLTISRKLLLGFFIVLLFLGVVSVITFVQFTNVDKSYSSSIEESFEKVNILTTMENSILKEQIAIRGYLVSANEENIAEFERSSDMFQTKADEYLSYNLSEEGKSIILEFIEVEIQYEELAREIIKLKDENQEVEIIQLMEERGNVLTAKITDIGEKARSFQEQNIDETSVDLSNKANRSKLVIAIISIIAFIVGVGIALYISRIISKPVQQISKSAEQIAQGNLLIEEIKVKNKDEIGQLAESFNQMVKNLRELIINVSVTSEQVASASEELMASAEQTSSATFQVTSSVQEVASGAEVQGKTTEESAKAVNEMSIGIYRISDTTSTVAESASETTNQAYLGNELLQKVVDQMKSINQSTNETNKVITELDNNSNEIGKIVEVITGISDQTNLLALNAAIESARAGEHGRGFSVVADEVRKLAEQSRASANQIANLVNIIQTDIVTVVEMMNKEKTEVNEGMQLVEETGVTFSKIMTSIESVGGEIQELSAVSEQMSASAEQVNSSIEEVSRIAMISVKSTAEIASAAEEQLATMEEITASASTLAKMAEEMREMVGTFKI